MKHGYDGDDDVAPAHGSESYGPGPGGPLTGCGGGCGGCLGAGGGVIGLSAGGWAILLSIAPGALTLYSPLLCPAGTVSSHTETYVEEDDDGTSTSWCLACTDATGHDELVPTWEVLGALGGSCGCPAMALIGASGALVTVSRLLVRGRVR
jgi:hypothetical protein